MVDNIRISTLASSAKILPMCMDNRAWEVQTFYRLEISSNVAMIHASTFTWKWFLLPQAVTLSWPLLLLNFSTSSAGKNSPVSPFFIYLFPLLFFCFVYCQIFLFFVCVFYRYFLPVSFHRTIMDELLCIQVNVVTLFQR